MSAPSQLKRELAEASAQGGALSLIVDGEPYIHADFAQGLKDELKAAQEALRVAAAVLEDAGYKQSAASARASAGSNE